MIKNVGRTDKLIRIILAVVAAGLAFIVGAGQVGGILLLVVAAVLLVTALVGTCPLYLPFRISTNSSTQTK